MKKFKDLTQQLIIESEQWGLVFEFHSPEYTSKEGRTIQNDLERRFKKIYSGSGSGGSGWDVSFAGPKKELEKAKKYVEQKYKKFIEPKYTTLAIDESVELDEALDMKKLLKIFNKLKKNDTVKIKFDSSVRKGKDFQTFVVTSPKRTVGKRGVERVIMKNVDNLRGVKYTLYNRDGSVSLAAGDMAVSMVDIKESVELLDEGLVLASDDLNAVKKTAQKLAKQSPDLTYYVVKHKTRYMKGIQYAYYEVYQSVDMHLIRGKAKKIAGYGAKVDMRESVELDELINSPGRGRAKEANIKRGRKSDPGGDMIIVAGKDANGKVFYATSIDRTSGDILKVGTNKKEAVKLTKGNAAKLVRGKASFVTAINLNKEIGNTKRVSDAELKKLIGEAAKGGGDNTAAVAKQVKQAVKKYTTGKLVVRSKGGKSRFIMVRADKIDNKLRKMILDIEAPTANVRDKNDISYGNISDRIISASVDVWVKALGLKESMMNEGKKFTKRDFSKLTKQELELLSMGFAMFTDGGPIIDAGNIHFVTPKGLKQTLKGFEKEKRNLAPEGKKLLTSIIKKTKPLIEQYHVGSIINQLQDSHMLKMPVDINIDGNIIHVTPDISENLINLHDELNEDNQIKMRNMLMSDSKSFVQLTRFAEER